jgi:NurA-like 5'-3' nuclease
MSLIHMTPKSRIKVQDISNNKWFNNNDDELEDSIFVNKIEAINTLTSSNNISNKPTEESKNNISKEKKIRKNINISKCNIDCDNKPERILTNADIAEPKRKLKTVPSSLKMEMNSNTNSNVDIKNFKQIKRISSSTAKSKYHFISNF